MRKKLYISDGNKKFGNTPENDYDPRYYDLSYCDENGYWNDEPDPEVVEYIEDTFGADSYSVVCCGTIYTENYDVMMFLQEETWYGTPCWFDIAGDDVSTVDELCDYGWEW